MFIVAAVSLARLLYTIRCCLPPSSRQSVCPFVFPLAVIIKKRKPKIIDICFTTSALCWTQATMQSKCFSFILKFKLHLIIQQSIQNQRKKCQRSFYFSFMVTHIYVKCIVKQKPPFLLQWQIWLDYFVKKMVIF